MRLAYRLEHQIRFGLTKPEGALIFAEYCKRSFVMLLEAPANSISARSILA
jgi:hypothetical protein